MPIFTLFFLFSLSYQAQAFGPISAVCDLEDQMQLILFFSKTTGNEQTTQNFNSSVVKRIKIIDRNINRIRSACHASLENCTLGSNPFRVLLDSNDPSLRFLLSIESSQLQKTDGQYSVTGELDGLFGKGKTFALNGQFSTEVGYIVGSGEFAGIPLKNCGAD